MGINRLLGKPKETIEQESLATLVGIKQQQALVETAQKAFGQPSPDEPAVAAPTGEIAKEAATKHTTQTLAFAAIDALKEQEQNPSHPRIQTQA